MRTWKRHDVGATEGFAGNVEQALRSIQVPILYMPSATDLYFPLGDAQYEAAFIPGVTLMPFLLYGDTQQARLAIPPTLPFLTNTFADFSSTPHHPGRFLA